MIEYYHMGMFGLMLTCLALNHFVRASDTNMLSSISVSSILGLVLKYLEYRGTYNQMCHIGYCMRLLLHTLLELRSCYSYFGFPLLRLSIDFASCHYHTGLDHSFCFILQCDYLHHLHFHQRYIKHMPMM